jgi:mono/diheme cytochrome c family protein
MRAMTRVLLLSLLAACGGGGTQIPRGSATDPGQLIFNGYTKPEIKCFECHNGNGAGTKYGPALSKRVPKLTDDQIKNTILDGKDEMPSFRGKLTDEEILQLATWLRHQFGGPAAVAPPA